MDEDTHTNESDTPSEAPIHQDANASSAAPHEAATEQTATTSEGSAGATHSIKDEYKVFGILGYILPVLFFLPMLQDNMKHDPYVRFHMNQQLILLATGAIVWFVGDYFLVMLFGYLGYMLMQLVHLGIIVLAIMGIIHVINGEQKELPLIGGFTLMQ